MADFSMPTTGSHYADYAIALVALWLVFGALRGWRERRAGRRFEQAADNGSTEPTTLHPVISAEKCVGCGACTHACPEGDIIGMIGGKAQLLEPASCIGHGACKTACPAGAIELVFGSARRGVDIPLLSPSFESNVPGVFIAGELGGMGLVANAIEQGRQAMEAIARRGADKAPSEPGRYDVIIVGGGPAGISASLTAKQRGLNHLTLEQDTLGGTVAHYPRAKVVMTRPAMLPLYGKVRLRRVRKERLLSLWQDVIAKTGIKIHQGVRVERITPASGGFDVATSAGSVHAKSVLLATGRRGSPRRLGVPGEQLSKVTYRLEHAADYRGRHVLVVGGGESALETVIALARQPFKSLTLCYRGDVLSRARPAIRQSFDAATKSAPIRVVLQAHVRSIEPTRVLIERGGEIHALPNDAVIICAGGVLPTSLLDNIGLAVERKFGIA